MPIAGTVGATLRFALHVPAIFHYICKTHFPYLLGHSYETAFTKHRTLCNGTGHRSGGARLDVVLHLPFAPFL